MFTYILVLAFAMSTERPQVLAPFDNLSDCRTAAMKLAKHSDMQKPLLRELGAIPLCYKLEPSV